MDGEQQGGERGDGSSGWRSMTDDRRVRRAFPIRVARGLLQERNEPPYQQRVDGMQDDIGQVEQPRPRFDTSIEQAEDIRDGKLGGKAQQRQWLIKVAVEYREQLQRMRK